MKRDIFVMIEEIIQLRSTVYFTEDKFYVCFVILND